MKNKMKYWRKMGNKVTIMVPKKDKDEEGNDITVDVPHILTGRQLKDYTYSPRGQKAPAYSLLKNLMSRAGFDTITNVKINPEVVNEAE